MPTFLPIPGHINFKRSLRTLDEVVWGIIEKRRNSGEMQDDLLGMLLEARDEETGGGMSNEQLRDEVMTIFLAGHETTANMLSWTWYLLAENPEVERKLHQELDDVLCGRAPALEDLTNLTYARMVIQECLRLYPPVWTISRRTIEDDEIGGYNIPAGTTVIVSPYVVHHNPAVWEEPEVFDPERFSPERSKDRPAYAFFPFGGGPRKCIGSEFAVMEATLALATIARRYRLRLVPNQLAEPKPAITLAPRHELLMTVEERTNNAMRLRLPTSRNRAER